MKESNFSSTVGDFLVGLAEFDLLLLGSNGLVNLGDFSGFFLIFLEGTHSCP